ncbi:MAG: hypothetical protein CMK92_04820 [Pseudomonas sp.]|nr:hypothetical protein [Pseudomonas sp.]|tara:strand:+ start:601 stop:1041 length:441 start_codon:yes stop_codon:yes gene_type:complete
MSFDEQPPRAPDPKDLPFPTYPQDTMVVREKARVILTLINQKMMTIARQTAPKDFRVDHQIDQNMVPMPLMVTVLHLVLRVYNDSENYVCKYSHCETKENTYTIHIRLSDKHIASTKSDERIERQIAYLREHKITLKKKTPAVKKQ